ncbi:uncharacterized protein PAC_13504 [Phialocephala subalpina]|uniref:Peptidase A2 domain-containing protein n=1 Tax=Phialocephala subalpina TaxID=576137 RepID=A0A1L7XF76_9HELO|nr:uncharacterized protein PAC_13504 [Phialocephala subalpina]
MNPVDTNPSIQAGISAAASAEESLHDKPYKLVTKLQVQIYLSMGRAISGSAVSVTAILDTGADDNCMSKGLVNFAGYAISQYTGRGYIGVGGRVRPLGTVKVSFRWDKSNIIHCKTFVVFDGLPVNMILGKGFISDCQLFQFNGKLLPIVLEE